VKFLKLEKQRLVNILTLTTTQAISLWLSRNRSSVPGKPGDKSTSSDGDVLKCDEKRDASKSDGETSHTSDEQQQCPADSASQKTKSAKKVGTAEQSSKKPLKPGENSERQVVFMLS
jgi:hypothetical protein